MFLKMNSISVDYITWLNPKERFNLIYDTPISYCRIITAHEKMYISPSMEVYKIICNDRSGIYPYDTFNKSKVVFYDKLNDIVLNEEKTHFAVLLSTGWNAAKWATNSRANLFDTAKILQILPHKKIIVSQLRHYYQSGVMKNLCIEWIPVNTDFVIYHTFFKGETYELVKEFKFVA